MNDLALLLLNKPSQQPPIRLPPCESSTHESNSFNKKLNLVLRTATHGTALLACWWALPACCILAPACCLPVPRRVAPSGLAPSCYTRPDETAPASPDAAKPDPAVPVGAAVTAIGFGQYPLGVGQVKYLQQVRCLCFLFHHLCSFDHLFFAEGLVCFRVLGSILWVWAKPSTCSRCAARAVPIISAPRRCTSTPFQTVSNTCMRLYLIFSATTAGRAGPAQQPLPEPMRCRSCIPASCILLLNAGRAEPAQQHRVY